MSQSEPEQRKEKRLRQTAEIHAALGRYVEAFEMLVSHIRSACTLLTSLTATPPRHVKQQQLMNVVFHSNVMTAGTLNQIYRALVGQIINDADTPIEETERVAISSVLAQFSRDFIEAIETRNSYLHGTWLIGWGNEETEDFSEIGFWRGKATADGLAFAEGPKNASEIDAMTDECKRLADFFLRFHGCFVFSLAGRIKVSSSFSAQGTGKSRRWLPNGSTENAQTPPPPDPAR